MPYLISGSAASIVPSRQVWIDLDLGIDARGRRILSDTKEVVLEFDSCTSRLYQQWENAVEAASGASIPTITILDRNSIAYRAYSGIYLQFEKRPSFESAVVSGPWSIRLREVAS